MILVFWIGLKAAIQSQSFHKIKNQRRFYFLAIFFVKMYLYRRFTEKRLRSVTTWKVPESKVSSGLYFPVFGLNTGIYSLNLRIESEYEKIQTRENSVLGRFSRNLWNQFVSTENTNQKLIGNLKILLCEGQYQNIIGNGKWLYKKMKLSMKDFFIECNQIRNAL